MIYYILLLLIAVGFCRFLLVLFSEGRIIVGTISAETIADKNKLQKNNFKILHSDQLRDKGITYEDAGKKMFLIFLLKHLTFQKVALFTSEPMFLKMKWIMLLEGCFGIIAVDSRVTREENIAWVKKLTEEEVLDCLPEYFECSTQENSNHIFLDLRNKVQKRREVMILELIRYSDDRFRKPFIDA